MLRLEAGQAVVADLVNYVAAIVAVVTDYLIPTLRVMEEMIAAAVGAAAAVFGLSPGIEGVVVPIDPAATADKAGTAGHTVKAEISLPSH